MADEVASSSPSDDPIRRLELIAAELKVRDDNERDRKDTADSKLASALAALPIVITLSTAAFLPLLPYANRLGCFGTALVFGFLAAIVFFVIAVIYAIIGLWPMRAKYAAISMGPLKKFADSGTYESLLRMVIEERSKLVKVNGVINGEKLGLYANAALCTVIGLIVLTLVVLSLAITFAVAPVTLLKEHHRNDFSGVAKRCRLQIIPMKSTKQEARVTIVCGQ